MKYKVPQHIIDRATEAGIVPGAKFKTATNNDYTGTVNPHEHWILDGNNTVWNGSGHNTGDYALFSSEHNRWATVITPAPSQGLEEGMATECSPAMRAAIIELAKELGFENLMDSAGNWVLFHANHTYAVSGSNGCIKQRISPREFMSKLLSTKAPVKPIKIGDYTVVFNSGSIKIGCTTVDNETVRAIAAKLKD